MIKTIIFDIGNVLMDFNFQICFRAYAPDEETYQKIVKATVQSPVWAEFDRGLWTDEEILEGFIKNDPSIESILRNMFERLEGIIKQRDYAIPWIRELKKSGYQVLVLSNFPKKVYELFQNEMTFLQEVDGGILSYQDQVIKPDKEIYNLLMSRYQLNPQECVFLDDLKDNIKTAKELGMHTVLFTTKEEAQIYADKANELEQEYIYLTKNELIITADLQDIM